MVGTVETNLSVLETEDRVLYNRHLHIPVSSNKYKLIVDGIKRFNKDVEQAGHVIHQYQTLLGYLSDSFGATEEFKNICAAFGNLQHANIPVLTVAPLPIHQTGEKLTVKKDQQGNEYVINSDIGLKSYLKACIWSRCSDPMLTYPTGDEDWECIATQ